MRSLILVSAVMILSGLMSARAEACSRMRLSVPRPQPELAALSGIVTGYVEATVAVGGVPNARGLRVRVDVGGVSESEEMFWYPLHTAPDCSNSEWTFDELATQYPRASRVTAVGRVIRSAGTAFIATNADDFGHIAMAPAERLPAAGEFEFDRSGRTPDVAGDPWQVVERKWYDDYEFYRTLTLVQQGQEVDRARFMERIVSYSGFGDWSVDHARREYAALLDWARLPRGTRRRLEDEFRRRWRER